MERGVSAAKLPSDQNAKGSMISLFAAGTVPIRTWAASKLIAKDLTSERKKSSPVSAAVFSTTMRSAASMRLPGERSWNTSS